MRRSLALLACMCALASACSTGSGTFAQSHAPTGPSTVLVAIGDYELSGASGASGSDGDHQDWTQLFFGKSLSRRSTLYVLSSPTGPYMADLLGNEVAQAVALRPDLVAIWVGLADLLDGMPAATFGQDLQQVFVKLDAARARVLVANLLPIYSFPAYRSCEAEPLACGLFSGALPSASQLADAVSGYDLAIERAAAGGRATVVDLTGTFNRRLSAAGSSASSPPIVDGSDLGLTPAGEQLIAAAFEDAYSASSR